MYIATRRVRLEAREAGFLVDYKFQTEANVIFQNSISGIAVPICHHNSSSHRNFLVVRFISVPSLALRLLLTGTYVGTVLCYISYYVRLKSSS